MIWKSTAFYNTFQNSSAKQVREINDIVSWVNWVQPALLSKIQVQIQV